MEKRGYSIGSTERGGRRDFFLFFLVLELLLWVLLGLDWVRFAGC